MPAENADWIENRLFILSELRNLRSGLDTVNVNLTGLREKDISQIRIDIAMLQVKSGIWGAAAGAMVVLIPVVAKMLT
jgi:hypothetical protein